jgi:hypothetical protein
MCRKRRMKSCVGQVMTEFALGLMITAALGSALFLFYQPFVRANLYGTGKQGGLGLETVVALPWP